jgi:predicted RNase H-like HicB family nuclease
MSKGNNPDIFKLIICRVIVAFMLANAASAGTVYLEGPSGEDSILITSGTGTEFELRLMADADIQDFRLYVVEIAFDKAILDTVQISDSLSLFRSLDSGFVNFGAYLKHDSTVLRIQSQVIGHGISADGPGLLATIRLRTVGTGIAAMDFDTVEVRDVNNNLMENIVGDGATVFVNAPPSSFDLLSPPHQADYFLALEDSLKFEWQSSISPYPGDPVGYELRYGTDPDFSPSYTTVIPGLTDTFTTVVATDFDGGRYYWKARACNSFDCIWSTQTDWYCDISVATYPESFSLIQPQKGEDVFLIFTDSLEFIWEASNTSNPGDYIRYDFLYSTRSSFTPGYTVVLENLSDTSLYIPASDLLESDKYYWKVRAFNTLGYVTWSLATDWYFDITVASNPGIFHLTEPLDSALCNLNSGLGLHLFWTESESIIPDDTITYTVYFGPNDDLPAAAVFDTSVMDVLGITLPEDCLNCRQWHFWRAKATNRLGFDTLSANVRSFMTYYRGDADGSENISILDVAYIINYLYKSGPAPIPESAGDSDCNGALNILDGTYLVNYLYKNGPPPCTD